MRAGNENGGRCKIVGAKPPLELGLDCQIVSVIIEASFPIPSPLSQSLLYLDRPEFCKVDAIAPSVVPLVAILDSHTSALRCR